MSAKYDSRQDIERRICEGFLVNDEFLRRVVPMWRDEFLESPELIKITHWCFTYFKEYGRAPRRDIEAIYMRELQAKRLEKSEAVYMEQIFSCISDEYERGEEINVDYLYDRALDYFNRRTIILAAEEAVDVAEHGEDLSRARIAGWRIAAVGTPTKRLPDPFGDPDPPAFDLSILPAVLRRFARTTSQSIGVEAAPVAWSAISACSGALDGSLRLQMKRLDPGFTVPPGIWILDVGDPSSLKSPVLKATFVPLRRHQAEMHKGWLDAKRAWDSEDEKTRGPEPRYVQLITDDPTPEGIRDLLEHRRIERNR